ncbi:MAG: hypothetical protein Q8R38_06135 [Candidatus Omnitrophota bacterium]|nr:hypothetical protein [Candidatus Omnitrophota bacterium]
MTQLLFFSAVYWINFTILIAFRCIDPFSAAYFYIFLVFFVFPIGHSCYNLLFDKRLHIEETFLSVVKILLAIPVIAIVNFIFGINYASNAALLLFSYAYIALRRSSPGKIDISGSKVSYAFAIIFSGLFTIISKNSFRIYSFFSDHVIIAPYPSDSSQYYATISSLVRHVGSFIHGYKISLYGGINLSALPSLLEIFEGIFVKFSGTDIVLFHSVIFPVFLILMLFCISLLPIFKRGVLAKIEFTDPWNTIFLGLIILAVFSYARQHNSLLGNSITALHTFLSWIYLLTAMKIYFSGQTLLKKDINTRSYITPVLLLCLIGFSLHIISVGIFLLSLLICLLYSRLDRRRRIYFVSIWAFAVAGSMAVLATVFKDYAFVFGELRISIRSFYPNAVALQSYINDLSFLKLIYKAASTFIHSDTNLASMAGGIYACSFVSKTKSRPYFMNTFLGICAAPSISSRPAIAVMCMPYMVLIAIAGSAYVSFCLFGYFSIIPIYYFFISKSSSKAYFVSVLTWIYMALLLVNYFISHKPGIIALYMPVVALLAVVLMVIDIVLSGGYFQFQKVSALLKSATISFLTIIVLWFNYSMFAVPYEKLNVDRKLYDVIEYVKKDTPSGSMILHNLGRSPYYAYFSGFAYRDVVMERYAYAFVFFKDHDERFDDIVTFYKKDAPPDLRLKIIDRYSATHILSSPGCPVDLRGRNFKAVFSNDEYTLYEYLK